MDLEVSDLENIEHLASQNYSQKEIALVLGIKPSLFSFLCADETHPVGKYYLLGRVEVDRVKKKKLLKKVKKGNLTALQIHDKKAKEQAFLDMKNDIYS